MDSRKLAEHALFRGAVQKIAELSPLVALLKRRKLSTVVELGTARGGTLWLWCRLAEPDATLISIDLPGGDFGGGSSAKDARTLRTYARRRQSLHFLRRDSHTLETRDAVVSHLAGRPVDFLFIDGDHRYSGVKRDFELYGPLVRNRGIIAFHDILFHPKMRRCKVDRFWKQVRRRFRHREFIDPDDDRGWGRWGGIGVLFAGRR